MLISVVVMGATSFSSAQITNEYLKKQEAEKIKFERKQNEDFKKFRKEYNEGINELDKDFKKYLKKEWKHYKLFKAETWQVTPKPDIIPEYKVPADKKPEKIDIKETEEPENIIEKPVEPVFTTPPPKHETLKTCSFDFYGTNVSVEYDTSFSVSLPEETDEKIISTEWEKLSRSAYSSSLKQLFETKKKMSLNDWGYYLLIKDYSTARTNARNERIFYQWFLLTRSNYKVRLAYKNSGLYLLMPSSNTIYEKPFFTFDGQRYYLIDGDLNNIFTYDKDYPDANIIMDLNLYQPVNIGNSYKTKAVSFRSLDGKTHETNVKYSFNSIQFYKDYPLADIEIYFDAAVSDKARQSLRNGLRPFITNNNEFDAVSFLLSFVQNSFKYETDQQQFGREKIFFPEELFYYPASDCEDRAVLFSHLVRRLTELKVVGVEYPRHMATAVKFNEDIEGDYITYNGEKYVICDPTYVNAPVGATMPEYSGTKVKIVVLK